MTITNLAKELMNMYFIFAFAKFVWVGHFLNPHSFVCCSDPNEAVDLEKKFEPSLLNGGVYLISLAMHVSTFAINYQGRPFRESITENRPLFYSLSTVMAICVLAATEYSPELSQLMELVPFPDQVLPC